jgi:hypothetical protein
VVEVDGTEWWRKYPYLSVHTVLPDMQQGGMEDFLLPVIITVIVFGFLLGTSRSSTRGAADEVITRLAVRLGTLVV